MGAWFRLVTLCLAAAGCAHEAKRNPMIARAAADLACDARLVRWHELGFQIWAARGCEKQARYVARCHEEFENPARPAYPPIEICEWFLEGLRPDSDAGPPSGPDARQN